MKNDYRGITLVAIAALLLGGIVSANEAPPATAPHDAASAPRIAYAVEEAHYRLVVPKDPVLSAILSAGFPGMGQLYTGRWQRAALFVGGTFGAVAAAGIAVDNLALSPADYDDPARGGDGDGLISTDEYRRWEKNPERDFSDLSSARKTVAIAGLATAAGLYIWNVIDAYAVANEHNRALHAALTGVQLGMVPGADGRMQAQLSIPLR